MYNVVSVYGKKGIGVKLAWIMHLSDTTDAHLVRMHTQAHIHKHTYTSTHIQAHIHKHTHTLTHTHANVRTQHIENGLAI